LCCPSQPHAHSSLRSHRLRWAGRYYIGRIKSIQLDYTEALRNLQQALRKAPQSSATGFRITVVPESACQCTRLCARAVVCTCVCARASLHKRVCAGPQDRSDRPAFDRRDPASADLHAT
jgi:hypothetical protein